MEKYRVMGELVVTNIYKIKKGDTSLTCTDYYTGEEVTIPLDERLSPSKNSAAYFNRYNKLKRTKEFTEKKLESDLLLLEYAQSVTEELEHLPHDASTEQIEEELERLGGMRRKSQKARCAGKRRSRLTNSMCKASPCLRERTICRTRN